jgi:hypothetical protein
MILKGKTINNINKQKTTMVNYQKGKVYKIEDINGEMSYIGSTTKDMLCQRMAGHRNSYTSWKSGNKGYFTVFEIFEKYGIDKCSISLLELVPCNTKDELTKREAHYIRTCECVNKFVPCRTKKEYRKDNQALMAQKRAGVYSANIERERAKRKSVCMCVCGSTYTYANKIPHTKTKHHLEYIANQVLTI